MFDWHNVLTAGSFCKLRVAQQSRTRKDSCLVSQGRPSKTSVPAQSDPSHLSPVSHNRGRGEVAVLTSPLPLPAAGWLRKRRRHAASRRMHTLCSIPPLFIPGHGVHQSGPAADVTRSRGSVRVQGELQESPLGSIFQAPSVGFYTSG